MRRNFHSTIDGRRGITDIKREIAWFYFRMTLKGRKKIADKAISKMGRKKLSVWMNI